MLKLLVAALCACALPAHAGCIIGPVFSTDKALHLFGEAALTAGTTYLTQDWRYGIGAAVAAGWVREAYKAYRIPGGNCEYSSITYDLAGMAIGAALGQHFFVMPKPGGVQVTYSREF